VWVHGGGHVELGDRVFLDAQRAPIELNAAVGATIVIGDDCYLAGGCSIEATSSITIGARCHLGAFSALMDTHFHPLQGDRRERTDATPITVENDVRLGEHAILLPGAHVGRGAEVGRRAVVRRRVHAEARIPGHEDPCVGRPRRAHTIPRGGDLLHSGPPQSVKASDLLRETLGVLRQSAVGPAALGARVGRVFGVVRAWILFRGCRLGVFVNAQGPVRVFADGVISLGDRVQFVRGVIPTTLRSHRGGELLIGARTLIGHAVSIEAKSSVHIGERCMLASMVRICDWDEDGSAPIVIGDDVWLAHGVIIEPGVTIGGGSVVSAGGRVCRDVTPRALTAAYPAVCIPLDRATMGAHVAGPRQA
jgi:maltose O-acetyltransferase